MGRRELSAKRGVKAGEVDGLPAACCALLRLQFLKGNARCSHIDIYFLRFQKVTRQHACA